MTWLDKLAECNSRVGGLTNWIVREIPYSWVPFWPLPGDHEHPLDSIEALHKTTSTKIHQGHLEFVQDYTCLGPSSWDLSPMVQWESWRLDVSRFGSRRFLPIGVVEDQDMDLVQEFVLRRVECLSIRGFCVLWLMNRRRSSIVGRSLGTRPIRLVLCCCARTISRWNKSVLGLGVTKLVYPAD